MADVTDHNRKKPDLKLMTALIFAFALVPLSATVDGPEWLRLVILVIAVVAIAVVSFFLLRDWKRHAADES